MLWFVIEHPSSAQSVPNGSFEVVSSWTDLSTEACDPPDGVPMTITPSGTFSYDPSPARGTRSGRLAYFYPYGGSDCWSHDSRVASAPFVVTRHSLAFAEAPSGATELSFAGVDLATSNGPASGDAFTNRVADVSAHCGALGTLELSPGNPQLGTNVDDLALTGTVCAEFLDADGDGACPLGLDADADGDCLDASEVDVTRIPDCDDGNPTIGACLELELPTRMVEVGVQRTFTVRGAAPGRTIRLASAPASGTTCLPAPMAATCVDLGAGAQVLGSAVANASGVATFRVVLPTSYAWGTAWVQAIDVAGPGGASSIRSNLASAPAVYPTLGTPAAPEPFSDPLRGWSDDGYTYPGFYDDGDCPDADATTAPGRGAVVDIDVYDAICDGTLRSWAFLVTHRDLAWARGPGDGVLEVKRLADLTPVVPADEATVTAPDRFVEGRTDVSAACGAMVYVDLGGGRNDGMDQLWDDVRQAGLPCPTFLDLDGNGLCPGGADLDGDGSCVDPGEPTPPPDTSLPIERSIADFESGTEEGFDGVQVVDASDADPGTVRGDWSGLIEGDSWLEASYTPLLVTWDTFVVSHTPRGTGAWLDETGFAPAPRFLVDVDAYHGYGGSAFPFGAPGVWSQAAVDTSSICGDRVYVLLAADGWRYAGYDYADPDGVLIDDVGFAGAPCSQFVDGDRDGRCREGVDLDGDRLCVDGLEPSPGVVQDGNDPG